MANVVEILQSTNEKKICRNEINLFKLLSSQFPSWKLNKYFHVKTVYDILRKWVKHMNEYNTDVYCVDSRIYKVDCKEDESKKIVSLLQTCFNLIEEKKNLKLHLRFLWNETSLVVGILKIDLENLRLVPYELTPADEEMWFNDLDDKIENELWSKELKQEMEYHAIHG